MALSIYRLPSGRTVEVEIVAGRRSVDSDNETKEVEQAGPGGVAQRVVAATLNLSESVSSIAEMCDGVFDGLLNAARQPEEIGIEISAKVGASGNLIVAGGAVEGSVKIALKYKLSK